MELSPICLFVYNRLDETKKTIDALQNNFLASESRLYIFSDGWKNEKAKAAVLEVREYIKTIDGFKKIQVIESEVNKGLAQSIITGVTTIVNKYGRAIVVEDDLITSTNFLDFMNQSLTFYRQSESVFSISGFCLSISRPSGNKLDNFFWGRAHPWGWATWKDRWDTVDWQIKDWEDFKRNKVERKKFNRFGTDLYAMLRKTIQGKINSWYVKFTYNQFLQNKMTVYPFTSKVINIGFTDSATHCDTYNRNKVIFDRSGNREFEFSDDVKIEKIIEKQLFHYKTIHYRAVGKIFTILMKLGLIKQKTQGNI